MIGISQPSKVYCIAKWFLLFGLKWIHTYYQTGKKTATPATWMVNYAKGLRNVFVIYPPTMVLPVDSMKKPWVYNIYIYTHIHIYIYLYRERYIDIAIPRYRYYSPILSLLSTIRVEAEKSLGEGMGLWGITGCSFYRCFFPNITGDYADMLYVWYMFGIPSWVNGHATGTDSLVVPTIYKAYFSGLCKGIYQPQFKWPYMVQYLHFRILEFPLRKQMLG